MHRYMEFMVQSLITTVFLMILSTPVLAKSAISLGHYFVDTPAENYQFTSLSMNYTHSSYKAKLVVPFIQREAFSNGLGNPLLKLSNSWRFDKGLKKLAVVYRQKLPLANDETTIAVHDSALGFEYNQHLNWGVIFIEGGHWWRHSVSYTRKNSLFGSIGIIKPVKKYVIAVLIDNKPTAFGDEDSMASMFIRKKLTSNLSASFLFAKGLNDRSPNNILGLRIKQKF